MPPPYLQIPLGWNRGTAIQIKEGEFRYVGSEVDVDAVLYVYRGRWPIEGATIGRSPEGRDELSGGAITVVNINGCGAGVTGDEHSPPVLTLPAEYPPVRINRFVNDCAHRSNPVVDG
jgi:hypothetical protein